MKEKSKNRFLWYGVAVGIIIIIMMMILSNVISVGEKLSRINKYLEYGFYFLITIVIYFLILRPIFIILFSPSFSINTTLDKNSRKNRLLYKKVAKRLIKQDILPEELNEELNFNMKNNDLLKESLNKIFNKQVKKEINKIIKKNAKTVMISTAISQNGRLDLYTVLVVNIKMIKEIVQICGFRPSMAHLAKLTVNIFTTALIAEGLEKMNLNELLPNSTLNALGEIPLIRPVLSSLIQGTSNALLTLRIGIVARKYLFSDAGEMTKETIRRGALLEAAGMLPSVIGDVVTMFPRKFLGLFKSKVKKEEDLD